MLGDRNYLFSISYLCNLFFFDWDLHYLHLASWELFEVSSVHLESRFISTPYLIQWNLRWTSGYLANMVKYFSLWTVQIFKLSGGWKFFYWFFYDLFEYDEIFLCNFMIQRYGILISWLWSWMLYHYNFFYYFNTHWALLKTFLLSSLKTMS